MSLDTDEFVAIRRKADGKWWNGRYWFFAPLFTANPAAFYPCGRAETIARIDLGLLRDEFELVRRDLVKNLKF